ncbi:MAG: radical SAM protein [bacterium]|nr:radical SAM protein [bacterium]
MEKIEKRNVLLTNIIIQPMFCDSLCKYCYEKESHLDKLQDGYYYDGELKKRLDTIVAFSKKYFNSPIIKISGGEIFLMRNLKELVARLLEHYPYVLLQTNGRHLDAEYLDWAVKTRRIFFQISLDGHTMPMNEYRFQEQKHLDTILGAVKHLVKNNMYVELTSVLHNKNIEDYDKYIDFLSQLPHDKVENNLKVTPIYIVDDEGQFKPKPGQLGSLEYLYKNFRKYKNILPPKIYLKNLITLLKGGTLSYACHNPRVSLSFSDDGFVKACTNILPEEVLNVADIMEGDFAEAYKKFGKTKFQKLLLNTRQRIPLCKNCYNFCSIYNLYFNDLLDQETLTSTYFMFDQPEVKKQLAQIKKDIEADNPDAKSK